MSVRSWSTGKVFARGLVAFAPATASAEPPAELLSATLGQSRVSGCAANGAAISGAAQALVPGAFGQPASGAAPIADENAEYFEARCGS